MSLPAPYSQYQVPTLAPSTSTPFAVKDPQAPSQLSVPEKITPNMPFKDANVELELGVVGGGYWSRQPREETLTIKTGEGADTVHIKRSEKGGLVADINGKSYEIPIASDGGPGKKVVIQTNGGADKVVVDDDVKLDISVSLGNGNNNFKAGAGSTKVYSGNGNDTIEMGTGTGYVEDHGGDNKFKGGAGYAVMYGLGGGNNEFQGGSGGSYMVGGDGRNHFRGGSGDNVMVGLKGRNVMEGGSAKNTFYTGKGESFVNSSSAQDVIYGKNKDSITRPDKSKFIEVAHSDAGGKAFVIEGSAEYKKRVEADLEMLRGSPAGQKMLAELDKSPAPINIVQQPEGAGAFYNYGRKGVERGDPRVEPPNDSEHGYITNGRAGAAADNAAILYDPSFVVEQHKRPPIVPLFHEMSHAYNGVNGTSLSGETHVGPDPLDPDKPEFESNRELQAVGIPTTAEAFDFDGDPSTPPTTMNPSWLTENGMLSELGLPHRERYFS